MKHPIKRTFSKIKKSNTEDYNIKRDDPAMSFLVRQHKMNAMSSVRLNLAAERHKNLVFF